MEIGKLAKLLMAVIAVGDGGMASAQPSPNPAKAAAKALAQISAHDWSSADTEELLRRVLAQSSKEGLEAVALSGDPKAETLVGIGMAQGDFGLVHDELAGAQFLSRAAGADFAPAEVNFGWLFKDGYGRIRKDERRAVTLFRMAADQGDAGGEEELGDMYRDDRGGLPVDLKKAIELYRASAAQGDADSAQKLARLKGQT